MGNQMGLDKTVQQYMLQAEIKEDFTTSLVRETMPSFVNTR